MSITSTFTDVLGLTRETDADMQKVLDALASLNGLPIEALTPDAARQQPTPADAVKQLLLEEGKSIAPEAVGDVKQIAISGPNGDIPLHVFSPQGTGPFPVIVYYHGGGFVIADTKVYEATPRALCNAVNAVVVSVDYHQAPEHKYPAAAQDAYAAYRWVLQNAQQLNGIPGKVAVAGESAGGNLATVVTLKSREDNVHLPLHQLLVYPVVDNDFENESYRENADAKPLNVPMMHWFFKYYDASPNTEWPMMYALPMQAASLRGLPPATVITAEIDPLCSEGKAYAERLKEEGVEVAYKHFDGVTHEFFGMGAVVEKANDAMQFAADNLRDAFSGEEVSTRDLSRVESSHVDTSATSSAYLAARTLGGASDHAYSDHAYPKDSAYPDQDDLISTLNDLIETCKDGEEGFMACAQDLNDAALKASLTQRSQQCADSAEELQAIVRDLGGDPETSSSLSATLHRRWIDIKSAVTGRDEVAVLEECERGEDMAVKSYQETLEKDLPPYVRNIVERQFVGVRANHDAVKTMRNNAEARS